MGSRRRVENPIDAGDEAAQGMPDLALQRGLVGLRGADQQRDLNADANGFLCQGALGDGAMTQGVVLAGEMNLVVHEVLLLWLIA